MDIQVVRVSNDEKEILKNLLELYCYEWSQYTKYDVDQTGSYKFAGVDCWTEENHFAFLIKVDGKLAGFVLVDKDFDIRHNSDFAISEFFVMHKYRIAGVGRYVAKTIFAKFHGKWELRVHPSNIASVCFWNKVIDEYTNGDFEYMTACQEVSYPDGTFPEFYFFET